MKMQRKIYMPDPHTGPPYPGLGLPLRVELEHHQDFYPIGAHSGCSDAFTDLLTVRELAMMHIMDRLTDKPDWSKKVWDEEIVDKWRTEAKAIPDIYWWNIATKGEGQDEEKEQEEDEDEDYHRYHRYQHHRCQLQGVVNEKTFDCTIKELRSKARYFEKTGIIVTMDACASAAKSDSLVPSELHLELRDAFSKLIADQSHAPDWHPRSKDMVLDLVHPSMYPLIYGRSKVFREEQVGIDDAISKWSGKGDVVPKDIWTYDEERDRWRYGVNGYIHPNYWNDTYQWLPANVSFQDDGTVKFTSYINNLHPQRYSGMYHTIEKLIKTALPLWDQCLNPDIDAGRHGPRIPYPDADTADDDIPENWIPSDPKELAHIEVNSDEVHSWGFQPFHADDDDEERKWELLRKARIPEVEYEDVEYAPKDGARLFDKFRGTGLQVIVKMVSIELTPEKPDFPAGGWHVEGQMNEHICATALYYLDCENVTTSSLSFRMQTDSEMSNDYMVGQQAYSWLEQIWGTELDDGGACLQNYGSVETHQGRLLAFPNVFQHRVSPFSLVDKTQPGHRRFIALWLVDPHQRVISTANVPPQQQDWWLESVLGDDMESRNADPAQVSAEVLSLMEKTSLYSPALRKKEGKLPLELMDMVWEHFTTSEDKGLLSEEEAKEHRMKLMEMRTVFVDDSEEMWNAHTYNFCEH
ncbi:hypothetical protein SLS60_000361 [Paraconiothyrium brasiliense]|uniref:Uncharacterized protein n=1 Tax=Paraconiothyrium brasiliense TaxID=300254 RepID=A0ABR3S6K7_9PLEO